MDRIGNVLDKEANGFEILGESQRMARPQAL